MSDWFDDYVVDREKKQEVQDTANQQQAERIKRLESLIPEFWNDVQGELSSVLKRYNRNARRPADKLDSNCTDGDHYQVLKKNSPVLEVSLNAKGHRVTAKYHFPAPQHRQKRFDILLGEGEAGSLYLHDTQTFKDAWMANISQVILEDLFRALDAE